MKHCKLSKKDVSILSNFLMTRERLATIESFAMFGVDAEVQSFLLKMIQAYQITEVEKIEQQFRNNDENGAFTKIGVDSLTHGLNQLKTIQENARKFGVNSRIVLLPLFTNQSYPSRFMFKVMCQGQLVASGGRFYSLLRMCHRVKPKKQLSVAAVDLSFNVGNVIEILLPYHESTRTANVVIVSNDKRIAIPLYTALLAKEIKCEIRKKIVLDFTDVVARPPLVAMLDSEDSCKLCYVQKAEKGLGKLKEIFSGDWKDGFFFETISRELST
ncbi:hypothetical protein Zmor_016080 [Zophobas morio]|uniref:Uncharacterized protein n=1 Tax=Zophobas morio TaxID=2755281 RepID=A0AA38II35_9CUCU|nr:hypothetical protein Zmor_016080 [Zophobas morio]